MVEYKRVSKRGSSQYDVLLEDCPEEVPPATSIRSRRMYTHL